MLRNTIKKAVPMLAGALIVSMVASILPTGFFAVADKGIKSETVSKVVVEKKAVTFITLEQAEQIALNKVNDKTAEITYYEVELTYHRPHYDMEVTTSTNKYEIEIDGITGKILEYEVEKIDEDKIEQDEIKETKIKEDKVKTNNGRFISKYEAKMAALAKVNDTTANLAGFEIELEKDVPHFLVVVKTSTHKYLMKIEAETGKVYDVIKSIRESNDDDDDDDDDNDDQDDKKDYKIRGNSDKINKHNNGKNNSNKDKEKNKPVVQVKYITKEKAIEIALAKIGTKAILEEIKFEKDDNPPKYELEMYDDKHEYEIEIHAITGAVLKFEREED